MSSGQPRVLLKAYEEGKGSNEPVRIDDRSDLDEFEITASFDQVERRGSATGQPDQAANGGRGVDDSVGAALLEEVQVLVDPSSRHDVHAGIEFASSRGDQHRSVVAIRVTITDVASAMAAW